MRPGLLGMFGDDVTDAEVIAWVNESNFDELIEYDVANGRCVNIYHVEGKYYVPSLDSSLTQLIDYSCEHMIHPDDRETFRQLMDIPTLLERLQNANPPGCLCARMRYKLQNGSWRWVEKYLFAGEGYGVRDGVARAYIFDIQNQMNRQFGKGVDHLYEASESRDTKTRLIGERAFLKAAIEQMSERADQQCCIAAIDLEHFRLFNDWYGRSKGDLLLAMVGETLLQVEEETGGVAGYFGQDDFYLFMPFDQQVITNLYKRISALFADLGTALGFRAMLGVSKTAPDVPILDLIDRAKLALAKARLDVKVGVCLFESKMLEESNKEYEVLLDFKTGLRNREFKVYLQPQCRISSGKVIGAEALARWVKPDGTVVPPIDFIPVLEKHGFITDLDCYIWEEACSNIRAWMDAGHDAIPLSVNVSQADFYSIDVPEFLDALMRKYDLPKELLKVEITESTFADSSQSIAETTQRLRDLGFVVLMDDFGSGYSSLNMLNSLNVDVIKLDAGFFRMSDDDIRKGVRIVESVVSMAKSLSLPIITEGVETKEQVEFLESLGCRFIQGFYYYRPMPVEDFKELISSGGMVDEHGFSFKANEQVSVREFFDPSLYSDAMLNNILGAVAFCLWHDDDQLDIVRFNEQFYEEIALPEGGDILQNIQNLFSDVQRERLNDLLRRAESDQLNGSFGEVSMVRSDGTIAHYHVRFYYLNDTGQGKMFYASVKDVTQFVESQLTAKTLADFYPYSIMFIRPFKDGWRFILAINGMSSQLGFTQGQIQAEFDDGRFLNRLRPGVFEQAKDIAHRALEQHEDFEIDLDFLGNDDQFYAMHLRADYIENGVDGISHILTISFAE